MALPKKPAVLLVNDDWPGNVRELKNALEGAMILEEGNLLKPDDPPFPIANGRSGAVVVENHRSTAADGETPSAPSFHSRGRHFTRGCRKCARRSALPANPWKPDQGCQALEHQPRRAPLQNEKVWPLPYGRGRTCCPHEFLTAERSASSLSPKPYWVRFEIVPAECV